MAERECVVLSHDVERPREIDHDAEQQQIEREKMKLSEIREALTEVVQAEIANIRSAARSLFFECAKPRNYTQRHPKCVERNAPEK